MWILVFIFLYVLDSYNQAYMISRLPPSNNNNNNSAISCGSYSRLNALVSKKIKVVQFVPVFKDVPLDLTRVHPRDQIFHIPSD